MPTETEHTWVHRVATPLGYVGSIKNAFKNLFTGGVIGGVLSGMVGAIIGAYNGYGEAEAFSSELEANGEISLGGPSMFAPKEGLSATIDSDTVADALEQHPNRTAALLGAADTGIGAATNGAVGGAATGFIKGGWVDYIVKEREMNEARTEELGTTTYVR